MTVPVTIADLSVSEGSNSPLDSDSITAATRPSDYIRAHGAIIRTLAASSTLAAGATTDLSTVTGTFVTLTGVATTVTALGTLAAGLYKFVIYNAAHTITHNATSLILLGGASRTVAAGDSSLFLSEGSGNWRELAFGDATGYQPLDADLTAIAALTTTAFGRGMLEYADAATAFAALKQAASETATGVVELATTAEAAAGTDTARAVTAAGVAAAIAAFGRFTSADQTITSSGNLTIAHGLGSAPKRVSALLKCTDAAGEAGYAQNDLVVPYFDMNSRYSSISADATNLYVRFSSDASAFAIANKSTGALASLTNTKWAFILEASI